MRAMLILSVMLMTALVPATVSAQTTADTALTLAPNGSASGGTTGDQWWKITIPSDGKLVVTTRSVAGTELDPYFYEKRTTGYENIAPYDIGSGMDDATHYDNLIAGTYYIKVARYSGEGGYTITSSFNAAALDNDITNNDSAGVSAILDKNGSDTGHLGFYANSYTDTEDWWKITIPEDGKLVISTKSDPTLELDLYIYEQNGGAYNNIKGYNIGTGIDESTNYDNLIAGTYYVRAFRYSGFGSYTITSNFTAATLEDDVMNNDSAGVSAILDKNGSDTGHLGFYANSYTDTEDWWKVTLPSDGKLIVTTRSDPTLELDLYIYEQNGGDYNNIKGYNIGSGVDESTNYDNLIAGTYYVRAYRYSGHGSYTITSAFTPALHPNDTEPNDAVATAKTIAVKTGKTGHLGYYGAGYTDPKDMLTYTVPAGWDSLFIRVTTEATLEADVNILDTKGETLVHNGENGPESVFYSAKPTAGQYILNVYAYSGYGSYKLIVTNTWLATVPLPTEEPPMDTPKDIADNDSGDKAVLMGANMTVSGSLGVVSGDYTDGDDWWKVTIPSDGKLVFSTHSDPTVEIDPYFYEKTAAGYVNIALYDIGSGPDDATHYNNLIAGTYYVRLYRYNGQGNYTLTSAFTPASLENDIADNDSAAVSVALDKNGSDTGHLGFYAAGYTDGDDWWEITIPGDGKLLVTTESDPTLEIDLYMYEKNGAAYNNIKGYNIGTGINESTNYDNLIAGTYYVRAYRYSGYGSFTIKSTYTPTRLENDVAANDSAAVATVLDKNGSDTGHLGFYAAGYTDPEDWVKITLPGDGRLFVSTQSDSTLEIDLYMYEKNGTAYNNIKGYNIGVGINESTNYDNLIAGDYYIRIYRYSGYGSYTVASTFNPAAFANDTEPNDSISVSKAIPVREVTTGHIGYYGRGYTDPRDLLAFTVPAGWDSLCVRITTEKTLECDAGILNATGDALLYDGQWGTESVFYTAKPAAGQYILNLNRYSGYGSYAVMVSNTWQPPITMNIPSAILPPTNVTVSDVGKDNGHALRLSWTLSASESNGTVNRYRIFRSRSAILTTPIPLSRFATLDSLLFWEQRATVLIDSVGAGTATYLDANVPLNGATYYYWLQATGNTGAGKPVPAGFGSATEVAEAVPLVFRVSPPFPNPFNPATTIRYEIPMESHVRIVIFDALGRKVATIADARLTAGVHETVWNGRSDHGQSVGSGVYLYRMEAGEFRSQGKMLLVR